MLRSPMGKLISGFFAIMVLLGIAIEVVTLKSGHWSAAKARNDATISDLKATGASCDIMSNTQCMHDLLQQQNSR